METRTAVAAIVVSSVVCAGVAYVVGSSKGPGPVRPLTHAHKARDCRNSACDSTSPIKIFSGCTDDAHPTADTCEPYAEEEIIITKAGVAQISFTIASNGFKFESDGIKFTTDNNGNNVFPCAAPTHGGKDVDCPIVNPTSTTLYKYLIHLSKGGVDLKTTDPWVVNY
jgi:hypothetical protein